MRNRKQFSKKTMTVALAIAVAGTSLGFTGTFREVKAEEAGISKESVKIYVSPEGNENGKGETDDTPVSLERAKVLAREKAETMESDIEIILSGGVYHLDETFKLTREDSGQNGYQIIYRAADGEEPAFSGGETLSSGWTVHNQEKGIYKYKEKLDFQTRDLYVNGQRAWLARSHQQSELKRNTTNYNDLKIVRTKGFQDKSEGTKTVEYLKQLEKNGGIHQLEAVKNISWRHFMCPVDRVEKDMIYMDEEIFSNTASPNRRLHYDWTGTWGDNITYFQNAYGLLDTPGEFYVEEDGTLYYIPRENENLENAEVIAPKLEQLLSVEGRNEEKVKEPQPGREVGGIEEEKIHDIVFDGITFHYTTYLMPAKEGYICSQAGHTITGPYEEGPYSDHAAAYQTPPHAAVEVNSGDGITFQNCEFSKLGSTGLKVSYGSRNSVIENNYFTDTSGGGIYVGDTNWHSDTVEDPHEETKAPSVGGKAPDIVPLEERELSYNNKISKNYVYQTGREYTDCVAIWCGYEKDLKLVHNTVEDVPYSAINVGWGWRETGRVSHMRNNYVAYNRLVNFMTMMSDGGGLYMIQAQPGTIAEYNYFNSPTEGNAVYLDAGLDYAIIRNNVIDQIDHKWISANAEGNHRGMIAYDNYVPYGYTHTPSRITFQGALSILGENYIYTDVFPQEAVEIMRNAGHAAPYEESPEDDYYAGYVQHEFNAAEGKESLQSSGANSANAVDGNLASVSATQSENNPWWQVDLRTSHCLGELQIYNSSKSSEAEQFKDYYIFISDNPFGNRNMEEIIADPEVTKIEVAEKAGVPSVIEIPENTWGRYLRIQLKGEGRLCIAELKVVTDMPEDAIPYLKDAYVFNNENKKDTFDGKLVTRTIDKAEALDAVYDVYTYENRIREVFFNGKKLPSDAYTVVDADLVRNEWIENTFIEEYLSDVKEKQNKWYDYTDLTLGKLRDQEPDITKGQQLIISGDYVRSFLAEGQYEIEIIFEKGMALKAGLNVTDSGAGESPEPNVIVKYSFDRIEEGGVKDDGPMKNDALLMYNDGQMTTTEGVKGAAYQMEADEKNFLNIPFDKGAESLNLRTNQMLIDFYAYVPEVKNHSQMIVNRRTTGASDGYMIEVASSNYASNPGALRFTVGKGANVVESKGAVPTGEWIHVTATWNDKEIAVYLNGVLQNKRTLSEKPNVNNTYGIGIGSYHDAVGTADYYTGKIDELLIQDSIKDTVEPLVLHTSISAGAEDIGATDEISITLSEPVEVNKDAISVAAGEETADAEISVANNILHIRPQVQWNPGTTYQVEIPAGSMIDMEGNVCTEDFEFEFMTGTFEMKPAILNKTVTYYMEQSEDVVFQLASQDYIVSGIRCNEEKLEETDYYVNLEQDCLAIKNEFFQEFQEGEKLQFVVEFSKEDKMVEVPAEIQIEGVKEESWPSVIEISPQNTVGVSVQPEIKFTFNENVQVKQESGIVIREKDSETVLESVIHTNDNILKIRPKQALNYGTVYVVEISADAVSNQAGSVMQESVQFEFTTGQGTAYVKDDFRNLTYDKSAPQELTIETVLEGTTIQTVALPNRELTASQDYVITDHVITLMPCFLDDLTGDTVLLVRFANGESEQVVITLRFKAVLLEYDFSNMENPFYDMTGHYNEADANINTVVVEDEMMGNVVKFDSTSESTVQVQASETLSMFEDLYIDTWIKLNSGNTQAILSKKIMGGNGFGLEVSNGTVQLVIRDTGGNKTLRWNQPLTYGEDAKWHHIIAAFENSSKTMSLSVDACEPVTMQAPNVSAATINAESMSLNIGHSINNGNDGSGMRGSLLDGEIAYLAIGNQYADIVKPRLLQSNIKAGATEINLDSTINLSFTTENFRVDSSKVAVKNETASEGEKIQISQEGNHLEIIPETKLDGNSVYIVEIPAEAICDVAGNSMAENIEIRFQTKTQQSKSLLEYFLNKAKDHVANGDTEGLVESVQKLFEEAIAEGEAVMADENASKEDVTNATMKLMKAIHALEMKAGDKTDLEMALELANGLDLTKYVEAGQAEFNTAKETANAVMANGDAMQQEVNDAWNALLEAMSNLRLKADKSVLEELLNSVKDLDLSQYTEETVVVYKAAFANANEVMKDETLSEDEQKAVDDAVKTLADARDGLKLKDDGNAEQPDNDKDEDENAGGGNNGGNDGNTNGSNNDGNGSDGGNQKPTGDKNAPKTGDVTDIEMPMLAMLLAGGIIVGMRKKRGVK